MSKSKNIYKKKYQLKCECCNKIFKAVRPNIKYCSCQCRANGWYLKQSDNYKINKSEKNKIYEITRKRNKKIKAISYLGSSCFICGYNKNYSALEFHHKNPNDKDGNIKDLVSKSWNIIEKELDKCILLCANCHREIHHKDMEMN